MDTVRPGFEKVTNTVQQNVTSNASTYAIIGGSVAGSSRKSRRRLQKTH